MRQLRKNKGKSSDLDTDTELSPTVASKNSVSRPSLMLMDRLHGMTTNRPTNFSVSRGQKGLGHSTQMSI